MPEHKKLDEYYVPPHLLKRWTDKMTEVLDKMAVEMLIELQPTSSITSMANLSLAQNMGKELDRQLTTDSIVDILAQLPLSIPSSNGNDYGLSIVFDAYDERMKWDVCYSRPMGNCSFEEFGDLGYTTHPDLRHALTTMLIKIQNSRPDLLKN